MTAICTVLPARKVFGAGYGGVDHLMKSFSALGAAIESALDESRHIQNRSDDPLFFLGTDILCIDDVIQGVAHPDNHSVKNNLSNFILQDSFGGDECSND